ncbi:MAG: DUF222 domain-containing protein, partial [Acidimicrobiales bacterium]
MVAATYDECSSASRCDAIEQLAALASATTAEMLSVIAAADARRDWKDDGATGIVPWLVMRLRVSHQTAATWARVAKALTKLPAVRACYAEGAVSWDQVVAVTRFAEPAEDERWAEELPGMTAGQVEDLARARRARTRADATSAKDRRAFAWRRSKERDGWVYRGFLPDTEGAIVNAALERLADGHGPNPETGLWDPAPTRRADALVDLGRQQLSDDPGPDPTMVVVHADAAVIDGATDGNGWLDGNLLPRDSILRLLCDTRIEFHVDGPDGTTVGIGRTDRTPPRWLRRRILRRDDGTCRFPGCGRRIRHLHHAQWWTRDGRTDSCNLVGLCWHHHHLVHEGGWTITGNADAQLTFTSPQGRSHRGRPPPLRPDTKTRARSTHQRVWA